MTYLWHSFVFSLSLTLPNEPTWEAHPEFKQTLVERFEPFFEEALKRPEAASLDSWIAEIERRVIESEDQILPLLGSGLVRPLRTFISDNNFLEAILTPYGENGVRLDAFNLVGLRMLREHGRTILKALDDLAQQPERYLLEWLISEEQFPFEVRYACLVLITHNHIAEENFLIGVLSAFGEDSAWAALKSINQIYANERNFWTEKDAELPVRRMEGRLESRVNVAPKRRILEPMFGFQSISGEFLEEYLPQVQIYHYYAAFALGLYLMEVKGAAESLIGPGLESLGKAYKMKTAGKDLVQLERMQLFYKTGAEHAIRMRSFLR